MIDALILTYAALLLLVFVPRSRLMRYVRQVRAFIAYRRALSAFDDARHFQRLAAQRAEEGAALERASTVLRLSSEA